MFYVYLLVIFSISLFVTLDLILGVF